MEIDATVESVRMGVERMDGPPSRPGPPSPVPRGMAVLQAAAAAELAFGGGGGEVFPQLEALFFENPWVYRASPGQFGILFLLRRDINSCLGAEASLQNRTHR